jgi:hypothetical protein
MKLAMRGGGNTPLPSTAESVGHRKGDQWIDSVALFGLVDLPAARTLDSDGLRGGAAKRLVGEDRESAAADQLKKI